MGRKCNFKGCDRKDFQPTIVNGWYWAPTGKRIPPPKRCGYCEWSNTGGLKEGQPDNREQRQGGKEEACIGILNDFTMMVSSGMILNVVIRNQSFVRRAKSCWTMLLVIMMMIIIMTITTNLCQI